MTHERAFRLGLTIEQYSEFEGVHAALALVKEDEQDTPLLTIIAGGVPATDEGAGEIADMLRDAADAIDEYLGKERVHTDTASLPAIKPPKRPTFNPRPPGPSRS